VRLLEGFALRVLDRGTWHRDTNRILEAAGTPPDVDDRDSTDDGLAAGPEEQKEDAGTDEPEPARPNRFPASMGLSVFLPPGEGDSIEALVSYADYDKVEVAIDKSDKKLPGWKRVPHGPVSVTVPLAEKVIVKGIPVAGRQRKGDPAG
jgi:hypothetical protein